MKQSLINAGILEKKTTTLKFPTNQQVPVNLIWHFIRGYYDGDGSLTYGKIQANMLYVQNLFCQNNGRLNYIFYDLNVSEFNMAFYKRIL